MKNLILIAIFSLVTISLHSQSCTKPSRSYTSISVSESHDDYSYRAKFSKDAYSEILDLLDGELDINKEIFGKDQTWSDQEGNFEIKLSKNKLTAYADQSKMNTRAFNELKSLLKEASRLMKSDDDPKTPTPPATPGH